MWLYNQYIEFIRGGEALAKIEVDNLRRALESMPRAHYGNGGRQLKARCPECNDSTKSERHTNFSIKTNFDDNEPLVFQCFRASCKFSGVVDANFLKQINCSSSKAFLELAAYNKIAKVNTKNKYNIKYSKPVQIIPPRDDAQNKRKYNYICNRFNHKFTINELKQFKILIDPLDFIRFNDITLDKSREKYYLNSMYHGIGFLSIDNSTMIVRRTDRKEYVIIKLFEEMINGNKEYVVPSEFDLMSKETPVLNIAEGSFDIMSLVMQFDMSNNHTINCAASGGISLNSIKYYIKAYGLVDRLIVNIYGDNDVEVKTYKKIAKLLIPYVDKLEVNLFYNRHDGEKDFGVIKEKMLFEKHELI